MLGGRFQDAAAKDVREQLVSGLLKGGGSRQLAGFRTVFGHAVALLSRAERRGGAGQRRSNVIEAGEPCKGPAAGIGRWYNQIVGRGGGGATAEGAVQSGRGEDEGRNRTSLPGGGGRTAPSDASGHRPG